MPKEIQGILDGIGGFFGNPAVQLGLRAIAIYFVVLWLAGAYWAFRDMQLRTENPILPYGAATLIIVFTPVFFPFAIIVYRIIRPQERIGEVYERALAEEALLAEVEAIHTCPTCSRRVHDEWIICPTCRTRLNRVCPNCEKLVGLDWSLCAWCGRDFDRPDVSTALEPRPARSTWQGATGYEEEELGSATLGAATAVGPALALEGAAPLGAGPLGAAPLGAAPLGVGGSVSGTVRPRTGATLNGGSADPAVGGVRQSPPLRGRDAPLRQVSPRVTGPGGAGTPRSGTRRPAPGPLSEP